MPEGVVQQGAEARHVIDVGVREQDVPDGGLRVERERGGGRAGVQEEGLIQQEGGRQAPIGRAAIGTQDRQSDRTSPSEKKETP